MRKFKVALSLAAQQDFDDYIDNIYYNYKAPLTAKKHYEGLVETLEKLSDTADCFVIQTSQSIVDVYGHFVRRVNYKKMAILYVTHADTAYILRIIPQSMISEQ